MLPAEKNDIEITEINTTAVDFSSFHLYVNVTSSIGRAVAFQSNHPATLDQIMVTVIDNSDFTPTSTEDSPVTAEAGAIFKINSALYYEGVAKFLQLDVKAGTQYINALMNSNILELQKAIGWYLLTPVLSQLLLKSIYHECKSQEVSLDQLNSKYEEIKKSDIAKFSESFHSELQFEFIPLTKRFFHKSFTWWKLYLKNDNVEYDLKDYFSKNFMNQSIENYNFVRGKIVERLLEDNQINISKQSLSASAGTNPLLQLKNEVINNKIPTEVQPVVFSAITESFLLYQLPISIISFAAYQYFDFTLNLAVALFSLGLVVGVNHLSKKWTSFSTKWMNDLFEEIRITLGRDCIEEGLVKELEERYQQQAQYSEIRASVIEVLKKESETKR